MNQQDIFASAQIIVFNPILNESMDSRVQYYIYLKKMIHILRWDKRTYTAAQIDFYREKLCNTQEIPSISTAPTFDSAYCYLLPFDLAQMTGFSSKILHSDKIKLIIEAIIKDFSLPKNHTNLLFDEFEAAIGNPVAWEIILNSSPLHDFLTYLHIVKKNIDFIKWPPKKILITATMSAGKSTLINALVGKNISRTQNMACTGKIHTIISKSVEDAVISEKDYSITLNASKEDLLNDNIENHSTNIIVGSYFNSTLAGKRIILLDSPGVNSSENTEHSEISQNTIKSRKYDSVLYILNATQLGTNDDAQHLEFVKKHLGHTKIIFVMNKVDQLISEDDNIIDSINSQRDFLISKGFHAPILCPISSRAAFLVIKNKQGDLTRYESRELDNLICKFEEQSLSDYYEKTLHCDPLTATDESDTLFINCGFAYLEKFISHM